VITDVSGQPIGPIFMGQAWRMISFRKGTQRIMVYARRMVEWLVNDKLERMWKEAAVVWGTIQEVWRQNRENPFRIARVLVEVRIKNLPEYKSNALPFQPASVYVGYKVLHTKPVIWSFIGRENDQYVSCHVTNV
jgi:hypothetical protein